jgi:hypothetical protein
VSLSRISSISPLRSRRLLIPACARYVLSLSQSELINTMQQKYIFRLHGSQLSHQCTHTESFEFSTDLSLNGRHGIKCISVALRLLEQTESHPAPLISRRNLFMSCDVMQRDRITYGIVCLVPFLLFWFATTNIQFWERCIHFAMRLTWALTNILQFTSESFCHWKSAVWA